MFTFGNVRKRAEVIGGFEDGSKGSTKKFGELSCRVSFHSSSDIDPE
jgi:hypothetical protein